MTMLAHVFEKPTRIADLLLKTTGSKAPRMVACVKGIHFSASLTCDHAVVMLYVCLQRDWWLS